MKVAPGEKIAPKVKFCREHYPWVGGNVDKIKQAKRLIRDFRKKLNFLMEDENADDVFLLAVQLVPLTKPSSEQT